LIYVWDCPVCGFEYRNRQRSIRPATVTDANAFMLGLVNHLASHIKGGNEVNNDCMHQVRNEYGVKIWTCHKEYGHRGDHERPPGRK